jgi:D-3-phosphoglycerate dehydrogenase / 2-oxoglutarate reductase
MKVLISDHLSDQGIEVLKKGGLQVEVKTKLTPEELIGKVGDYEGLVIRSGTKVTSAVIEAANRLKVIGRAGSGLDNVDLGAATRRGIVVMNTPGGNTVTTAEHTFALLMSLARSIPQATASVKAGRWEKQKFMGIELYNKTLGVIGLGQIGSYLAKLGQGFMMNVIAHDPFLSQDKAKELGIEQVELEEIFKRSDFISIHAPLTSETKNLINAQSMAKMKEGVRIINCARGGIVNEEDLYQSLLTKKVAGAAFDVFEKEPVDPKNPLLTLDNFICSPHLGAATSEAQENVAVAIAEQMVDYLVHGAIRNAANLPSIPADLLPTVRPYLILAEKLGAFGAQVFEGGLERVSIEYRGDVANLMTSPITIAALRGLLNPILEDSVNYVNAPIIAKERGIVVEETKTTDAGDFTSLIVLELLAGRGLARLSGTLYKRKDPRIVDLNGFPLEVVPEGHMLVLSNLDQPGVIGSIGNFLGQHQINIASIQLSREKPGGKAIAVIGIDVPMTPDRLQEIKKLPHILSAKQIKL